MLLRWALQRGAAVLTRSSSESHLRETAALHDFELDAMHDAVVSGASQRGTQGPTAVRCKRRAGLVQGFQY